MTVTDEHRFHFHSPLNSNALLSVELGGELTLPELKSRFLGGASSYEVLSFTNNIARLRFFSKQEASQIADKLSAAEVSAELDFDTLTHPGNIYVRGLGPEVTAHDLRGIFEPFGDITSCKICLDEYGRSKGYGFVNFTSGVAADAAIEKLNGLLINGHKFYLNHHIAKKERIERLLFEKQNFTNLYFKNFPSSFSEEQIKEMFAKFGEVASIFLPDNDNPATDVNSIAAATGKRFGFVNYKNHESAVEAILGLDNTELEQNTGPVSVSRAHRRDERKTSPLHLPPTLHIHHPPPLQPQPQAFFVPQPPISPQSPISTSSSPSSLGLPMPGPNQQQSNLYVKNLTQNIHDAQLYDIFASFGSIISAKIMTLEDGYTSRGFGFVCFKTVQEASQAMVEMDGAVVDGEAIHVSFAQKNNRKVGKAYSNRIIPGNGYVAHPQYYYHNSNHNGSSYYYGVVPQHEYPGRYGYGYGYQKPAYKKKYQPLQQQQQEQNEPLNPDDEEETPIDKITQLSADLALLNSMEAKFDKFSKEVLELGLIDLQISDNGTTTDESVANFLKTLVQNYDSKYEDLLNDLTNKELDLSEEFSKLAV